jgi:transposase
MVMIGIDPHKRTHTAVAVEEREMVIGERLVYARTGQVAELVAWADALDGGQRIWAVESAGGLGYLLSQQLLAAGEHVVDIPAMLASRVRVLSSGRSDKNDPNDARSVAIAALRAAVLVPVRVEDHRTVLRLLSRRHTQLSWTRNKAACRLHALMCDLSAGGINKELVVTQAFSLLERIEPAGAVAAERHRLALELVDDIDRLDTQRKTSKAHIRATVPASGTTLTDIFGVGDVVAATLIGHAGDPNRFATEDRFATTAPHPSNGLRGTRNVRHIDCPGVATVRSTMRCTSPQSPRSASHTVPAAASTTASSTKATPPKKQSARSNAGSATSSTDTSSPIRHARHARDDGPGRATRKQLHKPAWPATVLIQPALRQQPLPNPTTRYARHPTPSTGHSRAPEHTLDKQRGIDRRSQDDAGAGNLCAFARGSDGSRSSTRSAGMSRVR